MLNQKVKNFWGYYTAWAKGCIKPPDGRSTSYDYFYQMGDYEKDCSEKNKCICGPEGFENMDNKETNNEEVNNQWKGTTFVVMILMLSLIIFNFKKK